MHPNKNPQQSPWQRRRQQRRQQDDQLATERKQALDALAPRLYNSVILLQIFLIYVVASVFGIDDNDLLNPDSTVPVPLVDITLPTLYFFLLAPALIALLHTNLLMRYHDYQEKLHIWRVSDPKAQLDQLTPNSYDITFLTQDPWLRWLVGYSLDLALPIQDSLQHSWKNRILRSSVWFLLYFLPPAAICLSLFWFANYQNPWITLEHFALLIISYGASAYFSWRQSSSHHELKALSLWARTLLLIFFLLTGGYLAMSFWVFNHPNPLLTLAYITLLIIGGGISVHLPWSKICAGNKLQNLSRWLQDLLLSALPLVGTYLTALVISLTWISYELSDPWFDSPLLYIPKIEARGFIYQDLDENIITLTSIKETNGTNSESIQRYSRPIDLRSRSLRYSELSSSFLPRARLRQADLSGANLSGVRLSGANLMEAVLQEADLAGANLITVNLKKANLQDANLRQSQLQDAYLVEANLKGASIIGVNLQGANISLANLNGASLWKAQLQGASLRQAQLQGADLSDVHLQGADLEEAHLQGADLRGAQLPGAKFLGAQLQGASLSSAQLQGADFRLAQLQGVSLWQAQLQGADLSAAQLQGADLREAQLQGVWSDPDTVSDLNETGDRRKDSLFFKGSNSDLSGVNKQALSAETAVAIIAELEGVKLLYSLPDWRARSIDEAISRIRAAIGKPWTLEGSGAITGVLTQEMIDEILEQWDE